VPADVLTRRPPTMPPACRSARDRRQRAGAMPRGCGVM
jgi:hypothetical protein